MDKQSITDTKLKLIQFILHADDELIAELAQELLPDAEPVSPQQALSTVPDQPTDISYEDMMNEYLEE